MLLTEKKKTQLLTQINIIVQTVERKSYKGKEERLCKPQNLYTLLCARNISSSQL